MDFFRLEKLKLSESRFFCVGFYIEKLIVSLSFDPIVFTLFVYPIFVFNIKSVKRLLFYFFLCKTPTYSG